MIRQVRTISFKASSFHPIHPLATWTHCVPGHTVSLGLKLSLKSLLRIQKWVRLHKCHPFWTMDNVGRVSINVSVCDILIRREGLHHCDYWLVSSLSWVPNQTGLCSEQSGSDCCDCPRTVSSQHTNSQLQWIHQTWKPRKQSKDRGTNRY